MWTIFWVQKHKGENVINKPWTVGGARSMSLICRRNNSKTSQVSRAMMDDSRASFWMALRTCKHSRIWLEPCSCLKKTDRYHWQAWKRDSNSQRTGNLLTQNSGPMTLPKHQWAGLSTTLLSGQLVPPTIQFSTLRSLPASPVEKLASVRKRKLECRLHLWIFFLKCVWHITADIQLVSARWVHT